MMSIPLYGVSMFFALACLLRWTHHRRSAAHRLERSLRVYLMKRSTGFTLAQPRLKAA